MLQEFRANPRQKLAALWAGLMFLYIYADVFSFYRTGYLDEVLAGKMGPVDASQGNLLAAALLMSLPALMVFATLALPAAASRWANIALGAAYTLVTLGNLAGESWLYYLAIGAGETVLCLLIIVTAWRWPRQG